MTRNDQLSGQISGQHRMEHLIKIWCFFFTFQTSCKCLKLSFLTFLTFSIVFLGFRTEDKILLLENILGIEQLVR